MVFNFPHNCAGLFQNSPHEKKIQAPRPELHLWINVIAIEVMRMCTFSLTILFIVCTRAGATCVQHLMTTYLRSPVSVWVAPLLFFVFFTSRRRSNENKNRQYVSLWEIWGEKNHPATWALLRMFCFQSRIQADQLFPYIDLPTIILSSNVLNNRALSETAITGKPCDNMRSAVWLSAVESEGHAGSLHLTMQIIIQNEADKWVLWPNCVQSYLVAWTPKVKMLDEDCKLMDSQVSGWVPTL